MTTTAAHTMEQVIASGQLRCCEEHGHIEPSVLMDLAEQKRRSREHHDETGALLASLPITHGIHTFVYLIEGAGLVKIGLTGNLLDRLQTLRSSSPVELSFVLALPGSYEAEKYLHDTFAAERRHGEWFVLTARLLRFIVAAVQQPWALLETSATARPASGEPGASAAVGDVGAGRGATENASPETRRRAREAPAASASDGTLRRLVGRPTSGELEQSAARHPDAAKQTARKVTPVKGLAGGQ